MKKRPFRLQFETLSDFQVLPLLTRIFKTLKTPKQASLTQILVEAYNNAVVHGHHRKKNLWVGIDLSVGAKKATIRVLDQGAGFKLSHWKHPLAKWQTHGRGLALIRANANHVSNKRQGSFHIFEATVFYA